MTGYAAGTLTAEQMAQLAPYRVEGAIIMAAGSGSRLAPLSYEKPKGMLEVRGEILIERLIRQLREAGIEHICVVVGYMKEAFSYLEETFGVAMVENPAYADRNNHSSLMAAEAHLGNTYICASDQYLSDNVFRPYVYEPYCSAVREAGETYGLIVKTDSNGYMTGRGDDVRCGLCVRCPAYFDRAFSKRFLRIMRDIYDDPATDGMRWSDICLDHASELRMRVTELAPGVLQEFDYFNDLCVFERGYIDSVDSGVLDNICSALACERGDIMDVRPLSQGLTNLSFLFSCRYEPFVYRYPGTGTEKIINRESEAWSQEVAKRLGLDGTFVAEDPDHGWKISRYIPDCIPFDYRDPTHVSKALALIRKLHESGEKSPWSFDFYDETMKIIQLLEEDSFPLPPDFGPLSSQVDELAGLVAQDDVVACLCHNDFYGPNLLVKGDDMFLIDWEYSAMGDYAADIGNFIAQGSGYNVDEATRAIDVYFDRPATPQEVRHCMGLTAIVGFYWYVWALYKESQGNPVGEWLHIWYRAAKTFTEHALFLYRNGCADDA